MSVKFIDVKEPVLKKGKHYLTSDYKTRGTRKSHNGMDMIGENHSIDDVIAIDDGKVITSTYSSSAGYYVEIKHANNYISRYLHMKKNSIKVKKNENVKKGQVLGRMGNTGDSNGTHLHFAVSDNKKTPQDPLPYLLGEKNFKSDYFKEFVKNIQKSLGAKVDGIPGKETLSKTITVSETTNRKHKVVKYLQEYLYVLGYTEIGKADGIAGPKFTVSVKNFQKDNGCVVDGVITKQNKTWKVLLKLI